MSLVLFKTFDANRTSMEELLALDAFGHGLRESYERNGIEKPGFVDVQLKTLKREIRSRNADALEKRKNEIQRSLDALKTPSQKKTELQAEFKKLTDALKDA